MRVVVDTNVLAYYLLKTEPFVDELRGFWRRVEAAHAPASWEAELANVLLIWRMHRRLLYARARSLFAHD